MIWEKFIGVSRRNRVREAVGSHVRNRFLFGARLKRKMNSANTPTCTWRASSGLVPKIPDDSSNPHAELEIRKR